MKKMYTVLFLNLLLACSSAYPMKAVIYSHGFGESPERLAWVYVSGGPADCSGKSEWQRFEESEAQLTFKENKTVKDCFPDCKEEDNFPIGDDCSFFSRSGAMSYSHLGDSLSVCNYPDALGKLNKAVFYTKPAVHTLANHLYDTVQSGNESIVLVGRSCGAGTALNCLEKLANYNDNSAYFNGSKINSQEHAQKIIAAINNGAFVATAPFLSLKKANAVAVPSAIVSGLTFTAATTAAYYYGSDMVANDPEVAKLSLMGTGLLAYCLMGDCVKNMVASGIIKTIVPLISNGHFDPSHQEPLDAVEGLRGKLTCPILLHFNAQDGVLENPDYDTVKVYDPLANENAHIIITNDSSHNGVSKQFRGALGDFKEKYFDRNNATDLSETQPTINELKKKIYQYGIISRIWATKKWAISCVVLLSLMPLYRVLCSNFAH